VGTNSVRIEALLLVVRLQSNVNATSNTQLKLLIAQFGDMAGFSQGLNTIDEIGTTVTKEPPCSAGQSAHCVMLYLQ
jgi:hypothetical protein